MLLYVYFAMKKKKIFYYKNDKKMSPVVSLEPTVCEMCSLYIRLKKLPCVFFKNTMAKVEMLFDSDMQVNSSI